MNAGIQGLAADIFKAALVRIDGALQESGLSSRIVLQVHDEVVVEAGIGESEQVESLVPSVLSSAGESVSMSVPLEVSSGWGETWADAKAVT